MFTVDVPAEIIDYCTALALTHNFGMRFTANGDRAMQTTGLIGQCVVMSFFGAGLPDGKAGCDGGIDFMYHGKSIDVKTMGRTTVVRCYYTNNFLKLQDYFQTQVYIFCSYNKSAQSLTVCGWISKNDFICKRRFYPHGTIRQRSDGTSFATFADLYEIDNACLNDVGSVLELVCAI